ncbi:MAG: YCF48-related protein [bacterium]
MRWMTAGFSLLALASATAAQAWAPQTSGTANPLQEAWFTSPTTGWIVGSAGTALFTTDAGATWNAVALTGADLHDVAFLGTATGLIVGDGGRVFRTTNAGTTWSPVASGTASNLLAVAFGGPGHAYAAGRDGVILASTDDGASWQTAETGTVRWRDADASGLTAWIVGDGGLIRATTDGGATWGNQASGSVADFRGVHFRTPSEGWVAGTNDTALHTTDAGATWALRNAGINVGLNAVHFIGPTNGWAVGDGGAIFRTINGGASWVPEASGTTQPLNDVFFPTGARGWAVGDAGTVLVRDDPTGLVELGVDSRLLAPSSAPNPFRRFTAVRYALPAAAETHAALTVHDVTGRLVRTLIDGPQSPGAHVVTWDGRDASGARVPSGIYFYRLSWNGETRTGRTAVVR